MIVNPKPNRVLGAEHTIHTPATTTAVVVASSASTQDMIYHRYTCR